MHMSSHSELIPHRYLAAELLASVVWRLFPNVVLVGGGVNSLGFYYDFILENPLTENMLELIEVHLHRFIKEDHSIRSLSMMRENAQTLFEYHQHFFLAERAGKECSNILDLVQIEDFYGLCPPLSLTSTQDVGYVKLLESKELTKVIQNEEVHITRLVGTTQKSAKNLKSFVKNYELFLKKKDHRSIGPKLNLFSFCEQMGNLGVVWHHKGLQLRSLLQEWLNKQLPENRQHVATPIAVRQEFLASDVQLLKPFLYDEHDYCLRSSPLRQHLTCLQTFPLDFENLPWTITEHALVYRYYSESEWWGLLCTSAYLTDYTTICCSKEQVVSELISSLHFIEQIITIFGFKGQWHLIASRQKSPKDRREQEAIEWIRQAVESSSLSYSFFPELLEEERGEGPRLELRIQDVIGREWSASTLTLVPDAMGVRSDLGQRLEEQLSLVIMTRQIWGSLDRFIALLIEQYEGVFPFWLAPEQVRVIAIGEANRAYARQVSRTLQKKGLRVGLDVRQAKLGIRVHEAEKENVPYLVLLGEQERIKQKITVRAAGRFNQNESVDLEAFLNKLYQESLSPTLKERMTTLKGESESA